MVELCNATRAEILCADLYPKDTLQLYMTQAHVRTGARRNPTNRLPAADTSQEHWNGQGTLDDQHRRKSDSSHIALPALCIRVSRNHDFTSFYDKELVESPCSSMVSLSWSKSYTLASPQLQRHESVPDNTPRTSTVSRRCRPATPGSYTSPSMLLWHALSAGDFHSTCIHEHENHTGNQTITALQSIQRGTVIGFSSCERTL